MAVRAGGLALALACLGAHARADEAPLSDTTAEPVLQDQPQVRFFAFFLTRAETGNVAPGNDVLKGQTVGRLFGPNSTTTFDERMSLFVEQRVLPFILIEPEILDGWALMRLSFEIDWTWGDSAYNTGGNFGGGFAGDQVNLQTQNAEIEFKLPFDHWRVNVGLLRLFDNARDPYRTFFDTVNNTGNRLALWGSDAAGLYAHGPALGIEWRAGAYVLWENNISEDDDVWLFQLSGNTWLGESLELGFSGYYLRDTSGSEGGFATLLAQGLAGGLATYNGAFSFPLTSKYTADIGWLGVDLSYNAEFEAHGFGGSAFVFTNIGKLDAEATDTTKARTYDILGVAANVRAGYRYGASQNDHVVAEVMFTSGDDGVDDGKYSGVITGNTWTSPGAIYSSHGAYLLFPHINVVNRFYGAVADISNMGLGVAGGFLNFSIDAIRNVLTFKVGTAAALSTVEPKGGGRFIGVEGNARVVYRPAVFFAIEAHGAYLHLGDFYESVQTVSVLGDDGKTLVNPGRPSDPYTFFLTLRWLLF
jgi:hypothetical protein